MNIKRHFLLNPIGNSSQIIHRISTRPTIQLSTNTLQSVRENVANVPIRHTNLSNAFLFNPPGFVAPSVQVFKELVVKDPLAFKPTRNKGAREIQNNIKQICGRNGGGIVILDKTHYTDELSRLTSDRFTYAPLPSNPTVKFRKELSALMDCGFQQGILNKKEKAYLIPVMPRVPVMYYLPKIHKNPTKPPDRPIISGIDSVTARIGKYIDGFLQPLVTSNVW